MGNCQAIDAATLVIQHPNGKVDKFYWPVSAAEIMKTNPGHHVALLLSTTLYPSTKNGECPTTAAAYAATTTTTNNTSFRITRIKLLKPTDTLVLGHVYRLITTQEVRKGLWAKNQAKMKKNVPESAERIIREKQDSGLDIQVKRYELDKDCQVSKNERSKARTATATDSGSGNNNTTARSRTTWQPSLQSISEAVRKGLWAKNQAKMKKNVPESAERIIREKQDSGLDIQVKRYELDKDCQVSKNERSKARTATATDSGSGNNNTTARSRTTWQPSLQSISEAVS